MDNKICGRFFAMIFYSYQDPAAIRKPLHDSLHSFIDLADVIFTRKSLDGEQYRASGKYVQQLAKCINTADFDRSHFLRLHNGTGDLVQTATVEYWLRTIHPEFKSRTPNYIYAELPFDTDRDTAWETFRQIFEHDCFSFGMANTVITGHHEKHSRSGATAARELRSENGHSVGFWEIFGNQSLRDQLAPDRLFYGPSEFAAVNRQFATPVIENASDLVGVDTTANAHYFRVASRLTRAQLWHHLKAARLTVKRPWKYWKDDGWADWYQRVSSPTA